MKSTDKKALVPIQAQLSGLPATDPSFHFPPLPTSPTPRAVNTRQTPSDAPLARTARERRTSRLCLMSQASKKQLIKIGRPGYKITKIRDELARGGVGGRVEAILNEL